MVAELLAEVRALADRVAAEERGYGAALERDGYSPGLTRRFQMLHQAVIELRAAERHLRDVVKLDGAG